MIADVIGDDGDVDRYLSLPTRRATCTAALWVSDRRDDKLLAVGEQVAGVGGQLAIHAQHPYAGRGGLGADVGDCAG
jgi:hypothetical protein